MSVTQTKRKPKKLSFGILLQLLWQIMPQLVDLLNDNRDDESPVILSIDFQGGETVRLQSISTKGSPIDVYTTTLKKELLKK